MIDSKAIIPYKGDPRGSQWAKWDLHVHTPASVVQHFGDGHQDETWKKYIDALEALPQEIRVLGINDYFFLDGYRRVLKEKNAGRLPNIDLVLPVVELRISSFAGHKEMKKVNYHVIFSDELTADHIETFFLRSLGMEVTLDNGAPWSGAVCHREGLTELGRAIKNSTPEAKRPPESDLVVGFNNAAFPLEKIRETLSQTIFKGKFITVVGLAEWDLMRWDSGGNAAIKKDIINSADLVFTASHSPANYKERREKLQEQRVNDKLLDCSDAHFYASSDQPNRLGYVFSWLKADMTFQGLHRVVRCFDDRVFIGDIGEVPYKLATVKKNKTKYIRSIQIRKKDNSNLDEVWFDCDIPLNSDLVAIIGNQGNGKSALTDIIALCAHSKTDEYSFLTKDKFRDKANKAREFEASLTWEDGTSSCMSLDGTVDEDAYERIRYVPQRFFEAVTNETVVQEGGKFYREIKKAVFSHIDKSDRLGCVDLDKLIDLRATQIHHSLTLLRQDLSSLNSKITNLEKDCSSKEVQRLEKEILAKQAEISNHFNTKPPIEQEPIESSAINHQIEALRTQELEIQGRLQQANEQLGKKKQKREILQQSLSHLDRERRRMNGVIDEIVQTLNREGVQITSKTLVSITVDTSPISQAVEVIDREITAIDQQLNPELSNSLPAQRLELQQNRETIQTKLEQAGRAYQAYRTRLTEWEEQLVILEGSLDRVGSLQWLKQHLLDITINKPKELEQFKVDRLAKAKEIHQQLMLLVSMYHDLTHPVQEHIRNTLLTREKYRIKFTIELVERDIADQLFAIIGQGSGTFGGVTEGRERLHEITGKYDFSCVEDAIAFSEELLEKLQNNHKNSPPTPVELSGLLRKSQSVEALYDLIFGFSYLMPQYALSLNGKPLKQLSPGERGILLLIFYLIIDCGDEPLIIDQPEGNLNNQSIYTNLVQVFKEAKVKRQIIVVTHNPNLAVVCDAEQIIHSEIDFLDKNRVHFNSGSLENPIFNKLSLDVLEGTQPAFNARRSTYES